MEPRLLDRGDGIAVAAARGGQGRWRSAAALLLTSLAAGLPLPAQEPAAAAVSRFTAPDGSRFILMAAAEIPHVHWAIATWADGTDDPPGVSGLTMTTMHVSLNGTWDTGSKDQAAEREALDQLDAAWQRQMQAPGDPDAAKLVETRDSVAIRLGDPRTFERVLAALPAHRVEVLDQPPIAVTLLTTSAAAISDVARLLVERREQMALRRMPRTWMRDYLAKARRLALSPETILRREVLALVDPSSPAGRWFQQEPLVAPTREQSWSAWAGSQRPERTVHLLFGAFDPGEIQAAIEREFTSTSLPRRQRQPQAPPRPLGAQRRSIVQDMREPRLTIGWVLPPINNRDTLELVARWLADGPDSYLGAALRRSGHRRAKVQCTAPWPLTSFGGGLILVEIHDPDADDKLIDFVLTTCQAATATELKDSAFYAANMAMQRSWNRIAGRPRLLAAELARRSLAWPKQEIGPTAPPRIKASAVQNLLRSIFRGQPVIVEGKP